MNDSLGDRMKAQYEDRTRYLLPRRTYTILRLDGRAFHTYTKVNGFEKPFDWELRLAMIGGMVAVCEEASGAKFGYCQSDEASILLTDFDNDDTCAWFDGNIQKLCSIAASIFSVAFMEVIRESRGIKDPAIFDCRAFTIPDPIEVANYFVWREKDSVRNALQAAAQLYFTPRELHGKREADMRPMLEVRGHPFPISYPNWATRGTLIAKHDEWRQAVSDPPMPVEGLSLFQWWYDYIGKVRV